MSDVGRIKYFQRKNDILKKLRSGPFVIMNS